MMLLVTQLLRLTGNWA